MTRISIISKMIPGASKFVNFHPDAGTNTGLQTFNYLWARSLLFLLAPLLILLFIPHNLYGKTALKVGVYNNIPTIFVDEDGTVRGIFIDILEEIATKEGWDIQYVNGHFSEILQDLKRGDIDLLPAVAFSEEREKYIDYNFSTVMANWAELYTPVNKPITSLTELEGKIIAVKQGDIHAKVLKEMTETFNISCRFFEADSYETVFEMLHANYSDIGVVNRLFGKRKKAEFNVKDTPIIFNPIEMRYAVPERRNEDIIGTIDSYLTKFKQDENSVYYRALNRWLVVDTSKTLPGWLKTLLYSVFGCTLVSLAAALLLQYQVKKRTQELRDTNKQLQTQIEERKRAEEDLHKIARVVEASSDAMALIDKEHRHIFVNKEYKTTVARTDKDLRGLTIQDVLGFDFFENQLKTPVTSCLEGHVVQLQITAGRAPDNKLYWNVTVSPYESDQNEIEGYVIDIRDVTQQVELENRLKNAQKMEAIGLLAGGVAHDLNNILSGLVSYPDMLLINRADDDPLTKPLKTIKKSGERAAAIVQDLLTLARRGVGELTPLNLNNVIQEFLESPEHSDVIATSQNIDFQTQFDDELLNILGSPVHLLKIIMNLFINAVEAMEPGGRLHISTKNKSLEINYPGYEIIPPGDYATFSIADSGVGMSADDMNRIFEPFYSRKIMGRSGTGLGMSVVWGSLKDHNGYIDIQSELDRGTLFTFYFPVIRESLPEIEKKVWQHFRGNGQFVLVVDDMEEQRLLATEILILLGYSVDIASSGEEAVEKCRTKIPDLLLLDMIMPGGMDGHETYSAICALYPNQKAVIASGYSDSVNVTKAQELGAGLYIQKPYTVMSLAKAVHMELNRG